MRITHTMEVTTATINNIRTSITANIKREYYEYLEKNNCMSFDFFFGLVPKLSYVKRSEYMKWLGFVALDRFCSNHFNGTHMKIRIRI